MNYVNLSRGIATCSGACDLYVWNRPTNKIRILCNDFDFFMVADGALKMTWANGFSARIGPRQFAIVPPYAPVSVERLRQETSYWFCHFNFRMLPRNMHTRLQEDFSGPTDDVSVPVTFSAKEAPQVYKEYQKLAALKLGGPRAPWRFEAALLRLIGELKLFGWQQRGDATPSEPIHQTASDPRVAAVVQRIRSAPERRWTSEELAAEVDISRDRLNTLTRRVANKTIKQLIIEARFELAFQLLKDENASRASIKEVSAKCGFSSQHFFCRQFKTLFKMTPTQFRDSTLLT
jgi:AraC-like DNA-binding protein